MGSKIAEAFVEVSAQKGKLTTGLNAARAEINTFAAGAATKMAGLGKSLLLFGGIGAGALGIGKILGDTAAGERAVSRLGAALKSTGQSAQSDNFNEYADTLKDVYGVDDDLIRQTMTLAINMGATGENVKDLTQAAVGLSDVLGVDVKQALEEIQKAQEGNFRSFEKMFPAMKDMVTSEEKLAFVSKIAAQGLAQKRAEMETLGGSTARLSAATNDLNKSIGAMISAPLAAFFTNAAAGVKGLTSGTEEANRSIIGLDIALLKMSRDAAESMGDQTAVQQIQRQIDSMQDAMEQSITKSVNRANEAANNEGKAKLKALRDVNAEGEKSIKIFTKAEDIWKEAQDSLLGKNKRVSFDADQIAAPLGDGPLIPPGALLDFKKEPGSQSPAETKRQAANRRKSEKIDAYNQVDDPNIKDRLLNEALMAGRDAEYGSNSNALLFDKGVGLRRQRQKLLDKGPLTETDARTMKALEANIKATEEQYKAEKAKTDAKDPQKVSLDDSKPIQVKDENSAALASAIADLNKILPDLRYGVFSA